MESGLSLDHVASFITAKYLDISQDAYIRSKMHIKRALWHILRHTFPDRASYIPPFDHDRLNHEEIATRLAITSNEFCC